jgi:transposase
VYPGEAFMNIVGCDFHPSWQQVAVFDNETGELYERKLMNGSGEAEEFYRALAGPALVGVEACGNSQWFIDLMQRLGQEVWVGDAAQIRASYVRKQKTDKRDAGHILKLLIEGRFPRLWTPSAEQRDQRQLLIHRHKLVEIRARVKNGLQHLCLNQGVQQRHKLWTKAGQQRLQQLTLESWAGVRRKDSLALLEQLDRLIVRLDEAVEKAAYAHPGARLLMTQPGVGPITSLAFVLTLGDVSRFKSSKKVTSYLGLIPSEHSSGSKRRLGAITKQGNSFVRMLLVEAGQSVTRYDKQFQQEYLHRCHQKPKAVAKVAAARKLAVRLYWMLRTQKAYPEVAHIESSPRVPLVGAS